MGPKPQVDADVDLNRRSIIDRNNDFKVDFRMCWPPALAASPPGVLVSGVGANVTGAARQRTLLPFHGDVDDVESCVSPADLWPDTGADVTDRRVRVVMEYGHANVGQVPVYGGGADEMEGAYVAGWSTELSWDGMVAHKDYGHGPLAPGANATSVAEVDLGVPDLRAHTLDVQVDPEDVARPIWNAVRFRSSLSLVPASTKKSEKNSCTPVVQCVLTPPWVCGLAERAGREPQRQPARRYGTVLRVGRRAVGG